MEARWSLVETAWEMGISKNLLSVQHDDESKKLFVIDNSKKKTITSSRGALNGYQKGKCFYCFSDINLETGEDEDVDHFFPHTLKQAEFSLIDGVWNLLLSCKLCNRGTSGKFDRLHSLRLLERLSRRNEFLIASHHLLRETLINQTGITAIERRVFLNNYYQKAKSILFHEWESEQRGKLWS